MQNINIKQWLISHDDKKLFTIAYIGLSVVLSVFVSLFWLVIIVGIHAIVEYISLKLKDEEKIFFELFWHIKLDLALVFLALALSLYIEAIFGLLVAKYGTRFASFLVYKNTLRGIFMTIDDMALGLKSILSFKKKKSNASLYVKSEKDKATIFDYFALVLLFGSIALIVLSPYILELPLVDIVEKLSVELTPFPS